MEEVVSDVFDNTAYGVHNPIDQPFGVITSALRLNRNDSMNATSVGG
mgnify:CR=1 FL=1